MSDYQVVWTSKAKLDFNENIIFLLENWTEREARKFTKKAMSAISIIENSPYAFQETDFKNVRKVMVVKPISLYYRINQNTIELLRFWGNRKNPNQIKKSFLKP